MEHAIEMLNITKEFPGIKANDDITLKVRKGEIHALLGENGAGKTTLMSVLFGLYQADGGEIRVNGQKVQIRNPNDANDLGIGMVHQHFKLVNRFTVAENIVLGEEDTKRGFMRYDAAIKRIENLSKQYNLNVDPHARVQDISVGHQQRVEILKILYRDANILIFDEPTAALTPQEIDELMDILQNLANEGKSIVFITHKLEEIRRVADRVTVLRDGKRVDTVEVSTTTNNDLAKMMVGRDVVFDIDKEPSKPKDEVLQVEDLSVYSPIRKKNVVKNMNFNVRGGEILCVAGIEGNGQTELVYGLTGLNPVSAGKIWVNGEDVTDLDIRERSLRGVSHVPEDRQRHGLVLDFPLSYNMVLQNYFQSPFQQKGFLQEHNILEHTNRLIDTYDIRTSSGAATLARSMSGGNQQKAILGREIDRGNSLLIAVQPTRGLDVGAIESIHKQIIAARDAGKAVLIVSYDLNEVFMLSDRILVMYEGQNAGVFDPQETTESELGLYMSGSKRSEDA